MAALSATQNHYRPQAEWKKLAMPAGTGGDLEQNKISIDATEGGLGKSQKENPKHDEISYARLINYYL